MTSGFIRRHPVQRADHRGAQEGRSPTLSAPGRRQAQGLHHRPAQQSGLDCSIRAISVSDAFPGEGRESCRRRAARKRRGKPSASIAARGRTLTKNKPVIVLINGGLGPRPRKIVGGCAPGSPTLDRHRHALVRQRLGADHHSASGSGKKWRVAADNRALLHPRPDARSRRRESRPILRCCKTCLRSSRHAPTRAGEASLRGHLKSEG